MFVNFASLYYTIPKIKRELKRVNERLVEKSNYTIPKIKRELKHLDQIKHRIYNYTIPKIKRELKLQRAIR